MKESKEMMKKEVSFMKKKGAPKSMIRHEEEEAGMKKGVKKFARGSLIGQVPSVSRGTSAGVVVRPQSGYGNVSHGYKAMPVNSILIGGKPNVNFKSPDGSDFYEFYDSTGRIRLNPDRSQTIEGDNREEGGYRKGGKIKSGGSYRRAADGVASKGKTKGHVVKMREGGMASSYRKAADGIASKGKTKGKMVRMYGGGMCK